MVVFHIMQMHQSCNENGSEVDRVSYAASNFHFAIREVRNILELCTNDVAAAAGKGLTEIGVLKRASLILAVTTWETYIEDVLRERFEHRLGHASTPRSLRSTFNSVAHRWLSKTPKPTELYDWTGERWKRILQAAFEEEIASLNSPTSNTIRRLSKRYLDIDVTQYWKWPGVSCQKACVRLDDLIIRRGELVHRAKDFFQTATAPRKREASSAIDLVSRLVRCTNSCLGVSGWIALPKRL